MSRANTYRILLLLTLTVSAALMHEVIIHDSGSCTVCVQFHGTPPVINNEVANPVVIINDRHAIQPDTAQTAIYSRPTQTRSIRAPPSLLIES